MIPLPSEKSRYGAPRGGNAMALGFHRIEVPPHSIRVLVSLAAPRVAFDPRKDRWFAFTPGR